MNRPILRRMPEEGQERQEVEFKSTPIETKWRIISKLVFKTGKYINMDLLNENRVLFHTGTLLRQSDSGLEWNRWSKLLVFLFDNYMIITKPREQDGITKYHVTGPPMPLDFLKVISSAEPPTQRAQGLFRKFRTRTLSTARTSSDIEPFMAPNGANMSSGTADTRQAFPILLHYTGRLGGNYIFYAESANARIEWRAKLDDALRLRQAVQDEKKVFDIEVLSSDTFLAAPWNTRASSPAWNHESSFHGKVTCSVPFNTADGRDLVAIGCADGVWIGCRHNSRSMRQALRLNMVTQCAILESFGLLLVLSDKSLFVYHIETLVPSTPGSPHASSIPEKLNGTKDVEFFSVGTLLGKTLVIYMTKKGVDSAFRVLEVVTERTKNGPGTPRSRRSLRPPESAWFRVFRDFDLPIDSFDLVFLKSKLAILCTKGFVIMDLNYLKDVTLPRLNDIRQDKLAQRCKSCRPLGIFRSKDEFFLCYDEFGFYVDRYGHPSRLGDIIEWEGTAERVALHHPYILLFDSRFIEVRHVETGRLTQIITGRNISCTWDGRSQYSNVWRSQPGTEKEPEQEAKVHGVMDSMSSLQNFGLRGRPVAQRIFEIIPTVPLSQPESLASPSEAMFFALGGSPPTRTPLLPTNPDQ